MNIAIIALAALALAFSFVAQYAWGVQPCVLCWYQRGALTILALVSILPWRWLTRSVAFLGLVLSLYQVGVEHHFWKHPGCIDSGPAIELAGKSEEEKLQILKQQAARPMEIGCDQTTWRIWGISASVYTVLLFVALNGLAWFGWSFLIWI